MLLPYLRFHAGSRNGIPRVTCVCILRPQYNPGISNPKEVLQFKKEIKASGVEIRQREAGKEAMGYSPGLLPGQPGQFIIDDEASYAAWLHEMKHMRDDRKAGWRGYKASLQNKALRYQMEKDAYAIEIELAKKAGRKDIVKRLRQLLKEERQRIYSDR